MRKFTSHLRTAGATLAFALAIAACSAGETLNTDAPPLERITAFESSAERNAAPSDATTDELVDSLNNLGFELLLDEDSQDNVVLSPASIGHVVLMLRPAADDTTGTAIDEALQLEDGLEPHIAWDSIDQQIVASNGTVTNRDGQTPVVTLADRIWPTENANPDQEWIDLLATYHGADVSPIDSTQPATSRETVNAWVSDQTQGRIPDLLPDGAINANTTMVLTNAVYFEASWQPEFRGFQSTVFDQLDGTESEVPAFSGDLFEPFGTGDGWTATTLDYSGGDYSMLLVVPDRGRFEEIREELSIDLLADVDAALSPQLYELILPTWNDTTRIDLLPWLAGIGAVPGAYPGVGSVPVSTLDAGIHVADIEVDASGTIASAATGFVNDAMSDDGEPRFTFEVDRPFFYFIRHNDTGLVLFAGQVTDPTS